ncbi:MAG: hypothetical protein E7375_00355 [Clostridiales bacterium]|nr:hypothetical protein [Clostridiales bacterium]
MDLIRIDAFEGNELHEFVKKAFKEGTVPSNVEDFKECLNCDTTDGSPCFARQFGEGEDDAVMLFFYPHYCAVPPRYHKNIRNQGFCNVSSLVLEYQLFLAEHSNNIQYLQTLHDVVEQRFSANLAAIEHELSRHFSGPRFEEDRIDEITKNRGANALEDDINAYLEKYNRVLAYVDSKIAELSPKASHEKPQQTQPQASLKERNL